MFREHKEGYRAQKAQLSSINLIGALLMALVFCCFAGSYFTYTFFATEWLLETSTIWSLTGFTFLIYMVLNYYKINEMAVKKASMTFVSSGEKEEDGEEIHGVLFYLGIFAVAIPMMIAMRYFLNNSTVHFPVEKASELDYMSMLWMSSLLIAVDAMLVVILSWRLLRRKEDVLGVAAFVGATHVVFPLVTFGITVAVALLTQALDLPSMIDYGVQSALYLTAFAFIFLHTLEVHRSITSDDIDVINTNESDLVFSWPWIQKTWPVVFVVSIEIESFVERISTYK